jgi:hypothetical protein
MKGLRQDEGTELATTVPVPLFHFSIRRYNAGMQADRRVNLAVAVSLISLILLPSVLYVGGYFALSRTSGGATPDDWCRIYRMKWQAEIFKPAAKVESMITGDEVSTYWMP